MKIYVAVMEVRTVKIYVAIMEALRKKRKRMRFILPPKLVEN